jgi:peptidoglycan/LPS O-acetylase OafA/YrhL
MRDERLDILRAIAVGLVLLRHSGLSVVWTRSGWIGVDLFFVLSGFLISGLLFNEYKAHGQIRLGRFYARRALKIYPAFYVLIFVTLAYSLIRNHTLPPLSRMFAEVFFFQNYFPGLWNHTWSLAVEEHFYALFPVVLLLLLRFGRSRDPFGALPEIFVVLSPILTVLRYFADPRDGKFFLYPTHLRIDSLLCGVVLSYYFHFRNHSYRRLSGSKWLPYASAVCLLPAIVLDVNAPLMHSLGVTLLYFGFGGVLVWFSGVSMPTQGPLRWFAGLLARVGTQSYSIYLWHVPMAFGGLHLMRIVCEKLRLPVVYVYAHGLAYILGSIILGIAMARLVEFPVLRIRDRLIPSRSKAIDIASAKERHAVPEVDGGETPASSVVAT